MSTGWIVSLTGGRPGFQADVRAGVLMTLRAAGIVPTRMKLRDEDPWQAVDVDAVPEPLDGPVPHLLTLEATGVTVLLSLGERPYLLMWVTADAVDRRRLLACADGLADTCTPDLGWVFPSYDIDPPFADERSAIAARLTAGAGWSTAFDEQGPSGLGARTYFGPRALRHIPAAALRALPVPAQVTSTSWGGVRVDVVADLAAAEDEDILKAFDAATTSLAPTGFFATPEVTTRRITFIPPRWWSRGILGGSLDAGTGAGRASVGEGLGRLRAAAAGGATVENLHARNLAGPGADLTGLRAERADLTDADLRGTNLDGSVLVDVDLDGAQLENATFRGAQLDQVGLRNAEASHAVFAGAEIVSSFFEEARFVGSDFTRAAIVNTIFANADLSGADFSQARIDGCDFTGSQLKDARWTGARITGSTFDAGAEPFS